MLSILDKHVETPELLWTTEMAKELRSSLTELLVTTSHASTISINWNLSIPSDFYVEYRQINEELYVGEVYVRLYMKQPTFKLSNAIKFLECLLTRWEDAFKEQVIDSQQHLNHNTNNNRRKSNDNNNNNNHNNKPNYALIIGKEDFLSVLTSCIVCTLKSENILITHIMKWGIIDKLKSYLKIALDCNRRGIPALSVIRLFVVIVEYNGVTDNLISSGNEDIILELKRALDMDEENSNNNFHLSPFNFNSRKKEPVFPIYSTLIVELIKKLLINAHDIHRVKLLTSSANCELPQFLLENVISRSPKDTVFATMHTPSVFRVYCVDILKLLATYDEAVQTMLDRSTSWNEFRNLKHDLYLTVSEFIQFK